MLLNRPERIHSYAQELARDQYLAEPKKDGYRFYYHHGILWTRHGRRHQKQDLATLFLTLPPDTVVDGELGRKHNWLFAFDLLRIGGSDVTREPLGRRRMLLGTLGLPMVEQASQDVSGAYRAWLERGDEGMVLKRLTGHYYDTWLKVKP